jgi:tRNA(Ile)-lysidine synthase TilS/MesJ
MPQPFVVKKLEGKVNRTIYSYGLIEDGDRVMVGLSGGKDSYSLLDLLVSRRRDLPIDFEIEACHVVATDMDYRADTDFMVRYCSANGVKMCFREIVVDYDPSDRRPACFICSWKRRKMLFSTARENGCNKLALGHHLDDAIETLLLNMVHHSSISSIPPKLSMFDGELMLIRPLSTCLDKELRKYSQVKGFPPEVQRCQHENDTHRDAMRELIRLMERLNRDARENIYRSMGNIYGEYIVRRPEPKL